MAISMDDRRRGLMRLAIALAFLSVGFVFSREVSAHAELAGSSPAAGSAELVPPDRIELRYTEVVDPSLSSIALLDANGNPVPLDSATVAPEDKHILRANVTNAGALAPGVYTVLWGAYSAEDGHASSGSFTFSIGTGQAPDQSGQSTGEVLIWSVLGKWLELIGLVLLTGLAIFGLTSGAAGIPARNAFGHSLFALASIGLAGAAISFRAREVAVSGGSMLGRVRFGTLTDLLGTSYGQAWTVRFAALLVVTCGAVLLRHRNPRLLLSVAGIAGFIGLGSIAISGHAETVDPTWLGAMVDLVHMSAAAIWIGGLLGLLLELDPDPGSPKDRSLLNRQGNRFAVAIVLIVLAGVASAYWHIGGRRSLQQTDYGRTLLIKVAIVAVILGLAYYNRRVLQGERGRMRWVPLAIGAELLLATIVLLFSADLSQTPPGNRSLQVQVAARAIDLTNQATSGATTVSLSGVLTGDPTDMVTIMVSPDSDLQRVIVKSSLVTDGGATVGDRFDALLVEGTPGQYEFSAGRLGIAGTWTLDIAVRRGGVEDEVVTTTVDTSGLAAYGVRNETDSWGGFRITSHTALALVLTAVMLVIGLGGLRRITGLEPLASGFLLAASLLIAGGFLVSAARGLVPVTPDHAQENPADTSPGALTYAGDLYRLNCAICHGADGRGAGTSNLAHVHGGSADLTTGSVEDQSDGDLRYWIANGVPGTRMPAFDQALTEDEQWQLVLLIRQLQQDARDAEASE